MASNDYHHPKSTFMRHFFLFCFTIFSTVLTYAQCTNYTVMTSPTVGAFSFSLGGSAISLPTNVGWVITKPNGITVTASSTTISGTYAATDTGTYRVCGTFLLAGSTSPCTRCESVRVTSVANTCTNYLVSLTSGVGSFTYSLVGLSATATLPTSASWVISSPSGVASTITSTSIRNTYTVQDTGTYRVTATFTLPNGNVSCTRFERVRVVSLANTCTNYSVRPTAATGGFSYYLFGSGSVLPTSVNWVVTRPNGTNTTLTTNGIQGTFGVQDTGAYRLCASFTLPGSTVLCTRCETVRVTSLASAATCASYSVRPTAGSGYFTFSLAATATSISLPTSVNWVIIRPNGSTVTVASTANPSTFAVQDTGLYRVCGTFTIPNTNTLCTQCESVRVTSVPVSNSCTNYSVVPAANTGGFSWYLRTSITAGTIPTSINWLITKPNGTSVTLTSTSAQGTYSTLDTGAYRICGTFTLPGSTTLCTRCETVRVTNTPTPSPCTANFTFTNGASTGLVNFVNTSTGTSSATKYLWIFGDGSTSATMNPGAHVYVGAGLYNACLYIYDSTRTCASRRCDTVRVRLNTLITCQNFSVRPFVRGNTVSYSLANTANTNFIPGQVVWRITNLANNTLVTTTTSTGSTGGYTFRQSGSYRICATFRLTSAGTACTACETVNIVVPAPSCAAQFRSRSYNGNTFEFTNTSTGVFSSYNWSFGDGMTSTSRQPVHGYSRAGVYNVCLTISNPTTNCRSTFCDSVMVQRLDSSCYRTDCVFPGDANRDGVVNTLDYINLALANNQRGPSRPNASLLFYGQPATNWLTNYRNVNNKHADCNGNGVIDTFDFRAIQLNMNRRHNGVFARTTSTSSVYLQFPNDVILRSASSPDDATIEGEVRLNLNGNSFNAYNILFSVQYNNQQIVPYSFQLNADDNTWFGPNLFTDVQEFEEDGMADCAITRTDLTARTAASYLGKIKFTVPASILPATGSPYPVSMSLVNAIITDQYGTQIDLTTSNKTVTIMDPVYLSTESALASQVLVYPNPTSGQLYFRSNTQSIEQVQLFNSLGMKVADYQKVKSNNLDVNATDLAAGMYHAHIQLENGEVVSKRLVVKN
jgi:PKD repeat protein